MGRLTLNVLLSFAQFEREVIGERVRDKEGHHSCALRKAGNETRDSRWSADRNRQG